MEKIMLTNNIYGHEPLELSIISTNWVEVYRCGIHLQTYSGIRSLYKVLIQLGMRGYRIDQDNSFC